jgi:hypothetical protein
LPRHSPIARMWTNANVAEDPRTPPPPPAQFSREVLVFRCRGKSLKIR